MSMFKRIGTLIKSRVNKTVESAERADPISIMKSNFRDASAELNTAEDAMRKATALRIKAKREIEVAENDLAEITAKFEVAKSSGDDEFARTVGAMVLTARDKVAKEKADLDRISGVYDNQKSMYDDRVKLVDSYREKIAEAEANHEMSTAMSNLTQSVSGVGGTSKLDKIDEMMSVVDDSVDVMVATSVLADTDEVKMDRKLDDLKKQSDLDALMAG